MDDHGKVPLAGQLQVACEVILLLAKGRVVPVAVQPRFSQGHDAGVFGQTQHLVPVAGTGLGDVIGLDADGGGEKSMTFGEGDAGSARRGGGRDADDAGNAFGASSLKHFGKVVAEAFVIEVGVCVD
jgi:hypothetical protein